MRHVVIFSSGRSGSNRLLDILDQHEWTNCRNEINADDPQFATLTNWDTSSASTEEIRARWEGSVRRAAVRKGRRDRYELSHKSYLRPLLSRPWVEIYRRPSIRRPLFDQSFDWQIPKVIFRRGVEDKIVPVLKISRPPELFVATHRADPSQIMLHNLRDPGAMIRSWYNRFVVPRHGSPEAIFETVRTKANRGRAEAGLPPLTDAYSLRALLVAELWLWRLNNEPLVSEIGTSPRYLRITYDETSRSPVEVARKAYTHAGLDFSSTHGERVTSLKNELFSKPHSESLDSALVEDSVAEALDGSSLVALVGMETGKSRAE
jgi:hypothetical protein